jgi:hypothetical protein
MSNLYLREKHHLRRKLPVYAEAEPIDVHRSWQIYRQVFQM